MKSVYRAFIRQTRRLPNLYLRQFWRLKGFDDVRAIIAAENPHIRRRKLQRMSKDVRKLEAANNKTTHAFTYILDVAYGRKGKLKRELIEPLLTDPAATPPRIISAVESSRPPTYSPELRALLTSGPSRPAAVLKEAALQIPPNLPARADPNSEEARLLGPLSKRRQVNARWRFFVKESRKVRPPLQIAIDSPTYVGVSVQDTRRAGVPALPMQGLGVFEELEELAASSQRVPRWVRRRYRDLLDRLPILSRRISSNNTASYSVALSDHRLSKLSDVDTDDADLKWLENPQR
ncbi:hypothetical protein C8F01DRAFT_974769 [Mycena amicta]|nr:hypothetical protein C8F01DRAFT_974769 [Mycena amicta]